MTESKSNQNNKPEQTSGEHTFLPDFCNMRVIFLVILIAQLLAFILTLAGGASRGDFWVYLSLVSLFVQWIALGNILVLCVSRRFLKDLHHAVASISYYVLSLSVTLIVTIVAMWFTPSENLQPVMFPALLSSDLLIRNMAISAIVSAVALRYFYVQHQWMSNTQVEARSRIQALQARIRPHFLFNSMNTIASLTHSNPEQAEKAVEDLADLFRASLGHQDKVTLKEELNFTRRYINMEKLRLGDRLNVELKLQEGISLNTIVPALILQPIVENAIYHGVEPLTKGGTVNIDVTSSRHDLHFAISNPVGNVNIGQKRPGNKMAQENIKQRLQLAYGDFSKMEIRHAQGFYTVSFNIPIEAGRYMKVLIVDDEAPARDRLAHMLTSIDDVQTAGEATNGIEAVEMVQTSHPDVVLMDIRMPGMDGLEAARHLTEMDEPPAIIFTTAYSEHALEAFDTSAVGYLVKPVRQEKLENSIARAKKLTKAQIATLNQETNSTGRSHICARIRGNLELIPVDEILYFQADQKYITVRHLSGEVLIEDALKNLENEFEGKLIRIHRNALISTHYISGMEKNQDGRFVVTFREIEDRLEISRRHVAEVRKFLKSR